MSKELEAFKRIWALFDFKDMQYERSLVIKALTPPTVDEVCKALSDYWKAEVKYNPNRNHGFYLVKSGTYFMSLLNNGEIQFYYNDYIIANTYPPHLIAMIGKFYESLKEDLNV